MEKLFDLSQMIDKLKGKSVLIYGAGMVGSLVKKELEKIKIKIVSFVVTKNTNNINAIEGIPVIDLNNVSVDKNTIIIVATLSKNQKDMCENLNKKKINDYYYISETLFQEIRNNNINHITEKAKLQIKFGEMYKIVSNNKSKIIVVGKEAIYRNPNHRIRPLIENITDDDLLWADAIIVFQIDWDVDLEKYFNILLGFGLEVIVSYRSAYIKINEFDLFRSINKNSYIMSDCISFYRNSNEFDTEDKIIKFVPISPESLIDDKLCMGCGKCVLECPSKALQMSNDKFGNYKPKLAKSKCISCEKCISSCPIHSTYKIKNSIQKCYAFMAEDNIRQDSSSGGAFGVLATNFINQGGYVCGAAWNKDFTVSHVLIQDIKDLSKLQRSKYIRSDITDILPAIRKLLSDGEKVMFVGCPCQVAALQGYVSGLTDKLFTIDLLCTQAPSDKLFLKYLCENYREDEIKEIGFREKTGGWRPDSFYLINNNEEKIVKRGEDTYQMAYHSKLIMPLHCEYCMFANLKRPGDITIGDFWGIAQHNSYLDDKKGTSCILFNNKKGEEYKNILQQNSKTFEVTSIDWLSNNRIGNNIKPHQFRDRFYFKLKKSSFNNAVKDSLKVKYDIGLVGNWSYPNYGSELTYYALYKILSNMGYSVYMIEWPENSEWKPYGCTQLFEIEPYSNYEIAETAQNVGDMGKYNSRCDMFIQGSDQLLNPYLYHVFNKNVNLSWVDASKKKVAYALSFGASEVEYNPLDFIDISFFLKQYSALSVREISAVNLMKNLFEIDVESVLEPVFLCEVNEYIDIATQYSCEVISDKYIFAYILDPNVEKIMFLKEMSLILGYKLKIVKDASNYYHEQNLCGETLDQDISINEWLYHFLHCEYVITDSFHGTCFAIIFQKNFIAIANANRGIARFESILQTLDLQERLIYCIDEVKDKMYLLRSIDYLKVNAILENERNKSVNWLKEALNIEKEVVYSEEYRILNNRCNQLEQMLTKLIRGKK